MKISHPEPKFYIHKPPTWLKQLKERIKSGFGPKCKDFAFGCGVCMAYLALDILNDLYGYKFIEHYKEKKSDTTSKHKKCF